jgi:hypothetical protein
MQVDHDWTDDARQRLDRRPGSRKLIGQGVVEDADLVAYGKPQVLLLADLDVLRPRVATIWKKLAVLCEIEASAEACQ